MKLKICGMKYAENIIEVSKLRPDFMGFIFYVNSKRYVGENFQIPEIYADIKKVGVFVNDSIENILGKAKKHKLDFIQLHGEESPDFCMKISENIKTIKTFGIDEKFDFSFLAGYQNCCEYFLFDTKTKNYGGSGRTFDKNILDGYAIYKPYFLGGGIDLEEAKSQSRVLGTKVKRAFALDVNSKFETEPGLKDIKKLKKLKDELSGK